MLSRITAHAHHTPVGDDTATTAYLLTETSRFPQDQGDLGRATRYHQRTLPAYQRVLGAGHPITQKVRGKFETAATAV